MGCTPAAACRAVLLQATARWPGRSKISDGICPSAAHTAANPTSDHEVGNAVDLTHDPANGCDAHAWARQVVARRDSRVKYVISNGAIAASYPADGKPAWTWRPYDGSNPHTKHAHVSIWSTARGDTRPWFDSPAQPAPAPPALIIEEDEMYLVWRMDSPNDPSAEGYLVLGTGKVLIPGGTNAVDVLRAAGVKELKLPAALVDAIPVATG